MITQQFASIDSSQEVDVAIIGAGISGLYCAFRLLENDSSLRIAIVERLNRTGGRLDTDIIDFPDGSQVREEEGGMRFNYDMTELMTLNNALNLCKDIVAFPMASADNTNRYFLRGHNFTLAEAKESGDMIWSELYDLKSEEIGLSPTAIVTRAFDTILFENDMEQKSGEPPEFWTKVREKVKWKGMTLNQWQLWGLLRDMGHSEECIQMLTETIGFAGPFMSLANAGDALQILADFPKDPQYFTFEKGFSTLPNAVVDYLDKHHGENISIQLSTNVDEISGEDGSYRLTLTEASDQLNSSPIIPGGVTKELKANKLIVAVATQGAEQLFLRSPALRAAPDAQKLWENIHSALGMKLMKINLYFNKPWWESSPPKSPLTERPPVQFGPNFSNLPINAIYPFYALPEQQRILSGGEQGDPGINSEAGAALTIYCDFTNTNFWNGLQNVGPMFTSPMQEIQNEKLPQTLYAASEAVVTEARKQLQSLFGMNYVPEPVLTSYRLWDGEQDFEYAYHQWKIGVIDSEVRSYLAAPRENLHFCNEAISDMQGWVNGALRSANDVLKHFGIEKMKGAVCEKTESHNTASLQALINDGTTPRPRMGVWGS
jgi:hypothetical protein